MGLLKIDYVQTTAEDNLRTKQLGERAISNQSI